MSLTPLLIVIMGRRGAQVLLHLTLSVFWEKSKKWWKLLKGGIFPLSPTIVRPGSKCPARPCGSLSSKIWTLFKQVCSTTFDKCFKIQSNMSWFTNYCLEHEEGSVLSKVPNKFLIRFASNLKLYPDVKNLGCCWCQVYQQGLSYQLWIFPQPEM